MVQFQAISSPRVFPYVQNFATANSLQFWLQQYFLPIWVKMEKC